MRLRQNPVILKEMRSRMRGGKAFILMTVYLILVSGMVGLIFFIFASSNQYSGTAMLNQVLGKTVFGVVVGMEMIMISFIAPALTAGAISAEREHQTYDILRTTLLSSRALVDGKLISALSFLLILLIITIPVQSLAFLFGGVSIEEVLLSLLILFFTAIAFSLIGLFISSFMRNTLASTVVSYILTSMILFGIPIFIYSMLLSFLGLSPGSPINLTTAQQTILEIIALALGWVFVAINPLATAVVTEIIMIEEQSLFYALVPLPNGNTFPVLSPWIGFVLFYIIFSLALYVLSIRLVRRVDQ